jgi:microcin C transport system permease protein
LAKRRLAAAFYLAGIAVVILAAFNFAGMGLPGNTSSLGGLLREGLANPNAPWLGLTGLFGLAFVVIPLILLGRALHGALKDA